MTLILRPHHILCRLGFVGYGYSPEFIREMGRTAKTLASGRVKTVVLRPGFDPICRSCPHHEDECAPARLGVRGRSAQDIDRRVLRALKLKLGHPYRLPEIDERIAGLSAEDLAAICVGCEWQTLGECTRGQEALRKRIKPDGKK